MVKSGGEVYKESFNSLKLVMDYAVDMQGFKKPGNDFVLKELSIAYLNDDD